MEGDGCDDAAIDDHRHHLPHHIHKADGALITYHLGNKHHRLTHGFLRQSTLQEVCLDEIH